MHSACLHEVVRVDVLEDGLQQCERRCVGKHFPARAKAASTLGKAEAVNLISYLYSSTQELYVQSTV